MISIINANKDKIAAEQKLFEELLKLPGARKAKQGVIIETPDGFFHARGLGKIIEGLPDEAQFFTEYCTESEARRVFNIRNAHDYLLKRRAESIADSPRLVRQISYAKSEWEKRGRAWSLTNYYNKLNKEAKEYIVSLPKRDRNKFEKLAYGRVPMPQPNGVCFRSLVGDVVMVSDTLNNFLYFFSLANLGFFYGLDVDQRINSLIISLRIMKGVESLDFEMDPRENLPKRVKSELLQDVSWMTQFTFAHEFAHFALGHLDSEPPEKEHEVTFARGLEYEADAYAINLPGRGSFRAGKLAWGAHQIFLAFHAMERAGKKRKDFPNFSLSTTHPTAVDRINSIQNIQIRHNKVDDATMIDAISATESLVDMALDRIDGDERILSAYGSVYIPGFDVGKARDRIDF